MALVCALNSRTCAHLLQNDIAGIHKGKKQLTKMVLDMDSARGRFVHQLKSYNDNIGCFEAWAKYCSEDLSLVRYHDVS